MLHQFNVHRCYVFTFILWIIIITVLTIFYGLKISKIIYLRNLLLDNRTTEHLVNSFSVIYTTKDLPPPTSRITSTAKCPENILNKSNWIHEKWAYMENLNAEKSLVIYGAYYDDRPPSAPVVRVFGALTNLPYKDEPVQTLVSDYIQCQITFDDSVHQQSTNLTNIARIMTAPFIINGTSYVLTSFACSTDFWTYKSKILPCYVTLTFKDSHSSATVPVIYPHAGPHDRGIGICLGGLYDNLDKRDPRAMVEFFEANLMLGVSEVNIYDCGLAASTPLQRVFDYYQSLGVLTYINYPPVAQKWPPHEIFDAAMPSSRMGLNDCMTRNRHKYLAILVQDFDEIIVPGKNWSHKMTALEIIRNTTATNIAFKCRKVFLDLAPTEKPKSDSKRLLVEKYQTSINVDKIYTYMKVMVIPNRCSIVWAHNCVYDVTDERKMLKNGKYLPTQYGKGTVYHYRRSCSVTYRNLTVPYKNDFGLDCTKAKNLYTSHPLPVELGDYVDEIKTRTQMVFELLDLVNAPSF